MPLVGSPVVLCLTATGRESGPLLVAGAESDAEPVDSLHPAAADSPRRPQPGVTACTKAEAAGHEPFKPNCAQCWAANEGAARRSGLSG